MGGKKKKKKKEMVFLEANKTSLIPDSFFSSALITIFWSLNPKDNSYPQFYNTFSEFEENSKGENAQKSASYTYNMVGTGQTPAG